MISQKLDTGIKRLDDILYGGFPLRSNVMIYGGGIAFRIL